MFDILKDHLEEKLNKNGNLEHILQLAYFDALQVNEVDPLSCINTTAYKKWKALYIPLICDYVNKLKGRISNE